MLISQSGWGLNFGCFVDKFQLAYSGCLPWIDDEQNLAIDDRSFKISVAMWRKKCLSLAISACRSYQKALHLTPWQANLYTDIAISVDLISLLNIGEKHDLNDW